MERLDSLYFVRCFPSAAHVTSPPPVTEISVRPHPPDPSTTRPPPTGMTATCPTSEPSADTNLVCSLAVVIAVLSLLLCAACVLALLHRRKRNSKSVTPGRPEENGPELKDDGGSSRARSPGRSEGREDNRRDSEAGWRTTFTGVRAKSANAVLCLSSFGAPVEDEVTLQTETESTDVGSRAEGNRKLGGETEVEGGGVETADADVMEKGKQAEADGDLDEDSHRGPVYANAVPYLSIGTNQNKPSPGDVHKQATDASGQRWRTGKVMGRISTWPPTAVQWQVRCETKQDEEEGGSEAFPVWTPKPPGEGEKDLKTEEHPSGSDRDQKEDDTENRQMEDLRTAPNQDPLEMTAPVTLGHSQSSKPDKTTGADARPEEQLKEEEEETTPDPVTQTLNEDKLSPNQDLKSAASPARKKSSSSKAERRSEPKRAGTSRRRAENGSTGPLAPSGGASPDDETLLSGNEYAFMDLLHEVVQNNGRWTRDRWKQKEVYKKQRRHDRAAEGV